MRCASVATLFLVATMARATSGAETWAEKLGYPAGKRVLILYANHMGAAYEFNRPGQEYLKQGLIQSAGAMPACPWFDEFAKWCRENPGHDVGVCLSFTCPSDLYRWRPISTRESVPSLVDADGFFWRSVLQVALKADPEEVKREIDAQIERARSAGIRPTHLISDQGSVLTRADLTRAYLEAAEKYWIPAVVLELTPSNIELFRAEGFPLEPEMIEAINRYPLPKLDDLRFVPEAASYEAKRDQFYQLVKELPPGLTQIVTLPADRTRALELVSPRWQDRVWESRLLADPQVHQFIENEGVSVTNWIEVMDRFERGNSPDVRRNNVPNE
jgi:hypothetical protein